MDVAHKPDRSLRHLVNGYDAVAESFPSNQVYGMGSTSVNGLQNEEDQEFSPGPGFASSSVVSDHLVDLRSTVPSYLMQLTENNFKFFSDASSSGGANRPCGDRYRRMFHDVKVLLQHSVPRSNRLAANLKQYDVCEDTPCSGYRSVLSVYDQLLIKLLEITREVYRKRDRLFFSHARHARNLQSYVRALRSLDVMLKYCLRIMACSDKGSLFITSDQVKESPSWVDDILKVDQEPFMGRCLGFYMTPGMRNMLSIICTFMAAYADTYEWTHMMPINSDKTPHASVVTVKASNFNASSSPEALDDKTETVTPKTALWSLVLSGKYMLSAEARANKILTVTRRASIEFTRSFWGLNESTIGQLFLNGLGRLPLINKVIELQPKTLTVQLFGKFNQNLDGQEENTALLREHIPSTVDIEPPSARTIPLRLISNSVRQGQLDSHDQIALTKGAFKELSNCLIFHLHGGGFVSQSSQSSEVYLNDWAKSFDVPIVSVDYSLAPRYPFPQALHECFYAYCWCLENARQLGSTAGNIVFVGDSSGGNLCTAVAMMAAVRGVRRPDALMTCYAAFMVKYVPSPSRVLNTIDPLLPMGITVRCLAAYAGVKETGMDEIIKKDLCRREQGSSNAHVEKSEIAAEDKLAESSDSNQKPLEALPTTASCNNSDNEGSFSSKSTAEASDESWDVVSCSRDSNNSNNNKGSAASTPDSVFEANSRPEAVQARQARLAQLITGHSFRGSLNGARRSLLDMSAQVYEMSATMLSSGYAWLSAEMGWDETRSDLPTSSLAPNSTGGGVNSPENLQCIYRRSTEDADFKLIPALVWQNIDHAPDDPFLSPFLATDEQLRSLPDKIVVVGAQFDPILDDSVEFAKRLRAMGKNCAFQCAYNMPHGFLTFIMIDSEAHLANEVCKEHIKRLLGFSERHDNC